MILWFYGVWVTVWLLHGMKQDIGSSAISSIQEQPFPAVPFRSIFLADLLL